MNKTLLQGNLGKDPKIITSQNKRIAFLRVATTEHWQKDGEKHNSTDWHNVVVFKDQAVEYAADYLKHGDEVFIEGKLKHRRVKQLDGSHIEVSRVIISSGGDTLRGLFRSQLETEGEGIGEGEQLEE